MKVMRIGSELICIVCIHTECTFLTIIRIECAFLTTICIECAFSQSTSIGGLKANCIITGINVGVMYLHVIDCTRKQRIKKEITSITLLLCLG